MNNIYFISDVHLSFDNNGQEKEKRKNLLDFLDYIEADKDAAELYVLGDLFDFWFEWYHVIPKYWAPVLFKLKQLTDAGVCVKLVAGNHDFYLGGYLEEELGVCCVNEYCQFERNSKRFFAAHGDGYARKDRGYRLLKRIIRSRVSIFLFKTFIPADLGMLLARWSSRSSRKWVKIEKHSWAEEYFQAAQKKFAEGFDYVVLAHIHFPMIREDNDTGKTYVNCGDWINQFSYALYDGSRLMLKYWKPRP
jgi:UDP-2,3-diacylglucosamine hydrolase